MNGSDEIMEKVHFEINWHIKGNRAKVINLKGFLTPTEIVDTYGRKISDLYFIKDPSCTLSLQTFTEQGTVDIPNIYFAIGEDIGKLVLWETVPLDKVKFYNKIVAKSAEHLNELIEEQQKMTEDKQER
jgi:hypothetical protein